MTIKEMFSLFSELQNEKIADIKSTKLAYCINKNLNLMNKVLDPFRIKMPDRIQDYRAELRVAQNQAKEMGDNVEGAKELIAEVEKRYEVDKKEFQSIIDKQEEKLAQEMEFDFYLIKKNDLPEDLTPIQYAILTPLIKE